MRISANFLKNTFENIFCKGFKDLRYFKFYSTHKKRLQARRRQVRL